MVEQLVLSTEISVPFYLILLRPWKGVIFNKTGGSVSIHGDSRIWGRSVSFIDHQSVASWHRFNVKSRSIVHNALAHKLARAGRYVIKDGVPFNPWRFSGCQVAGTVFFLLIKPVKCEAYLVGTCPVTGCCPNTNPFEQSLKRFW